jgi:predicted nucleotidyltransferase
MFTAEHRSDVLTWLLEMARSDPRVTGGALIGSLARGAENAWSDIDVTFGIKNGIAPETVLEEWTAAVARAFGVIDQFDLTVQSSIYRVLLLPDGLEIDVSVTPEQDFSIRGPHAQLLFGAARQLALPLPPEQDHLIGLCWHHVLHAHSCIERGKLWQAEYWISALRDHTLELICLRLGESAAHGRGFDRLPATVTVPFTGSLVRSLDLGELRRALAAATACLIDELAVADPARAERLRPVLEEFGTSPDGAE